VSLFLSIHSKVFLRSCYNLLHFRLVQNHWANFNQTWQKSYCGEGRGVQDDSNKRKHLSPRGDTSERINIYFKKFFKTNRPTSIKLGANHPWVKRIQNFSNDRSGPLKRGVNNN
jgi:hypothetical protein